MKIPKMAIENHQFTLVMMCLLVLAGIVSLITMPRSEDPPVSPAGSSVIVVYPGANPSDIEQLIVDPIESALHSLDDIRYLTSNSADNIGIIAIEFTGDSDPEDKYSQVVQKVNSIRSQLPENLSLDILKWSITNVAVYQIAFISDSAAYPLLEYEAERLKDEIEKVSGVKEVELDALPEQEIRVSVDMPRLGLYQIPLSRIMGAIQDANTNIPGGYLDMGSRRLSIKTSGSYQSLDEIRNTVIHSFQGRPVYLADVATVGYALEDQTYMARVNGKRAVFLKVTNQYFPGQRKNRKDSQ